jgi:hypothetical protein
MPIMSYDRMYFRPIDELMERVRDGEAPDKLVEEIVNACPEDGTVIQFRRPRRRVRRKPN